MTRPSIRKFVLYFDAAGPVAVDLDTGRRRRVPSAELASFGSGRGSRSRRAAAWNGNVASALYAAVTRNLVYLQNEKETRRYLRDVILVHARPPSTKRYPGGVRKSLSRAVPAGDGAALGRILVARRTTRDFSRAPVSWDDLSVVLRATWGPIGYLDAAVLGRLLLTTSPSAGGMHPMECYVVAWNVRGLPKGLWHYDARSDGLRLLRRGDFRRSAVRIASGQEWVARAGFLCVMTAVAGRTLWKYPYENFYRSVWLEAGHVAQTFALVATGRGLGPFQTAAIQDGVCERFLGIDGAREFPVYLCGAGVPRRRPLRERRARTRR